MAHYTDGLSDKISAKTSTGWLLGRYDGVVVLEAPDEESATRLLLMVGMQGNVRTETMRAFSEEEMEGIIQGLP